jgi:hypothetical protein
MKFPDNIDVKVKDLILFLNLIIFILYVGWYA